MLCCPTASSEPRFAICWIVCPLGPTLSRLLITLVSFNNVDMSSITCIFSSISCCCIDRRFAEFVSHLAKRELSMVARFTPFAFLAWI